MMVSFKDVLIVMVVFVGSLISAKVLADHVSADPPEPVVVDKPYVGEYYERDDACGEDLCSGFAVYGWTHFTADDIQDTHKGEIKIDGRWYDKYFFYSDIPDRFQKKRDELEGKDVGTVEWTFANNAGGACHCFNNEDNSFYGCPCYTEDFSVKGTLTYDGQSPDDTGIAYFEPKEVPCEPEEAQ